MSKKLSPDLGLVRVPVPEGLILAALCQTCLLSLELQAIAAQEALSIVQPSA